MEKQGKFKILFDFLKKFLYNIYIRCEKKSQKQKNKKQKFLTFRKIFVIIYT